jgi:dTDP-4-dehydrorhamnose 3,5-epimerase
MKILKVFSLAIPEIKVIIFSRFADTRGYFTEHFRKSDFYGNPQLTYLNGINFVQHNESYSKKNVLRGMHFQWNPFMGKLVRTINGHIIDLACDIRKGSPSFGKVIAYDMPANPQDDKGEWIWVPPGFAHGNLFLAETTIEYLCSGEYNGLCEAAISPLSGDLDWTLCTNEIQDCFKEISSNLIISEKDRSGFSLKEWSNDERSNNFIFGKL